MTRGALMYTNIGHSLKPNEILLEDLIDYVEQSPKTSAREACLTELYSIRTSAFGLKTYITKRNLPLEIQDIIS